MHTLVMIVEVTETDEEVAIEIETEIPVEGKYFIC